MEAEPTSCQKVAGHFVLIWIINCHLPGPMISVTVASINCSSEVMLLLSLEARSSNL